MLPSIRPYVRGFDGTFKPLKDGQGYVSVGAVSQQTKTSLLIHELPVKCWTENYKEKVLMKLREKGTISGILENHTTTEVSFTVTVKSADDMAALKRKGLEAVFKLTSNCGTSNMHAFDADGVMSNFETPEDIIEVYFPVRMALYEDRKSVVESEMKYNAALHRSKARFIELVIAGEIDLISGKKTKQDIAARLCDLNFSPSSTLNEIRNDNAIFRRRHQTPSITLDGNSDGTNDSEFDYLLNMPLSSLTTEKVLSLREEAAKKEHNLELARKTTASDLWIRDLDRLEPFL